MMNTIQDVLNRQVANWNVLFVKLHNYHWYVKGPHFFTLHEKFEELYNEAATNIDELAERLLVLKGTPVATMKEYLDLATVQEAKGSETAEEMVQNVINDFELLIAEIKEGMEVTEREGDEVTHDMLLSVRESLAKHNWMLRAFVS
ncbi:DNA starvation/stationary phase protection protein [Fictibacillus phosphorivorans]|uniref:DNA starvation/stationary phase protection protein n=1 Tax=Fictibacillus phosphorivorans TaxID=1221500 RepID=A0A163PYX4_9BACL|nr:Dps family protein [Fictibacillus phosphorivorans]KZE64333.1 DNA starvation/stationary phase protection protein [Fictibacillus phosphorivorans]